MQPKEDHLELWMDDTVDCKYSVRYLTEEEECGVMGSALRENPGS